MAKYNSKEIELNISAENLYSKVSNPENLRDLIDKIPADKISEDKRSLLEKITVSKDTITVAGSPVGALSFKITEKREPELVKLSGEGSPVPLALTMNIAPAGADKCKARVDVDIEIPALLKPMIGGQIQKIADGFGDLLHTLPFA